MHLTLRPGRTHAGCLKFKLVGCARGEIIRWRNALQSSKKLASRISKFSRVEIQRPDFPVG